jgi:hypothetical protein
MWNLDTLDTTNITQAAMRAGVQAGLQRLSPAGIITLQNDLDVSVYQMTTDIVSYVSALAVPYTFVTIEQCVWGSNFVRHPSYAYMHRTCSAAIAKWPTPTVAEPCPVTTWSDWSMCDANCGIGTQTRVRYTLPPSLQLTAAACNANTYIESAACSAPTTCTNGASCSLSEWTAWGACSNTCGGGTRIRTRELLAGSATSCGPVLQTQLCNTAACATARRLRRS